jgi:LacI family transcriptional regulator
MTQIRRIALLMGQDAGFHRQVLQGIRAYAIHKKNWLFHNAPLEPSTLRPLREWGPHGIIAHLAEKKIAREVLKLRRPVVDTACAIRGLKVPAVDVDHVAVGELAAEHFLERGYQHFGFFGGGSVYYAQVREASFRQRVGQAGFDVSACHLEYLPRLPAQASWKNVSRQVRQWLKGLSKPVAVLADHDAAAHELADMCQQLGLRVPDEVAILGVDNDDLECQLTFPPLSSIAIPAERIGYEAAKLLERMLLGRSVACEPIYLPPLRVVTRQSTSTLAIADPVVAAALRYIRQRVGEPVRVSSIASDLAVPRRGLEKKFRALLGRSVLAEIHRARVDQAKELLVDTDLKMLQVARRLGFSNSQRLALVFRKITGMTPGAYRRQSRLGER